MIIKEAIRLHRNIEEKNFMKTLNTSDAINLTDTISGVLSNYNHKFLKDMDPYEVLKLKENFTSSPILFNHDEFSSILYKDNIKIYLMEEDHIVISICGDDGFSNLYRKICNLDDEISTKLKYSFDEKFGYLTSDPSIVGTGLKAYVILCLPASTFYGIKSIKRSVERMGYVLEPYRLKRERLKNIYVLKNQVTIGVSEKNILDKLSSIADEIVEFENTKRKKLYLDYITVLEDMVNRSYGLLRNARILSTSEMIDNISVLDMGVRLQVIKKIGKTELLDDVISLTDASICSSRREILDRKSKDILRANLTRKLIKEEF